MAAVAGPATPQRPLPGAYMATPAAAPTIFAANAATLRQNPQQAPANSTGNASSAPTIQSISPVERAARTINDTLAQEARFPELESYITQGTSGEYELPSNQAWVPFQKLKQYDLPPSVLEQANQSGLGLLLGIFPALGHAWAALDNCLYLYDYTLPNPELIGFEDNNHPISAVKLVTPKPGVFIPTIQHLLVVVTSAEMILLGVAAQTSASGARSVLLYKTQMSIQIRGLGVDEIVHTKDGRIFFVGSASEDVYEFQYQQDEGWFRGRTARICHTRTQLSLVQDNMKAVGQYFGPQPTIKRIIQLAVDDTRGLMYSLSSTSELKVWLIKDGLVQSLMRSMTALLQNTGHFSPRTDLLSGRDVYISSISAIPATEASKLCLMATTNTGCRLYISLTRGYGYNADASNPPSSMQILHIRFPPRDQSAQNPASPGQNALQSYGGSQSNVDTSSRLLTTTTYACRSPPGYFMAFMGDESKEGSYKVFCSAPDSARLKNPQDTSQPSQRFAEYGMFVDLPGKMFQVTSTASDDYSATNMPLGFGNELALQFDKASAEIAIVTSNAIQIIRRRRLVDVFAAIMRYGSSDSEGREGDVKRFLRTYGRAETAATALAVACGQGMDVTSDSRLTSITDSDVLEGAKNAFINHSGNAEYNSNSVVDNSSSQIDAVRPSARHEGMALYISRLVRSIWKATVIKDQLKPGEGLRIVPTITTDKLRNVQRDLHALSEFIANDGKNIEGLSGPPSTNRPTSHQQQIALQGEHRAMHSLVQLIATITEGISFALVLFDERIDDILAVLSEDSRRRSKELTYEALFVSNAGRDLAKELVKAIVNRSIASGSNVDTVAERLRRRCGSFCSADDVVIFKAQEQVKRASEAGSQSETGRVLLNESQRLFQKVAASLSMEHLHWATEQYVQMSFYAGAIQLCLLVAAEKDRAKRALGWLKDGMPDGDARREAFDARKQCYDLVFAVIQALDQQTASAPETMDGQYTVAAKRRNEAYDVVNASEDAVFQTCLYDWYVSNGQADRLLDINTQYVVDYLTRRSAEDRAHADLLWRYHAHHNDYLQAASVQLDIAHGYFELSLEQRIECLSRARTNASTRQSTLMDSRQSKQQLLREISDLLDVANIQDDLYQRMKSEPRLSGERREEILRNLNGQILPVDELFNQYADQASYYDICLLIYQVADHRNPADIKALWQSLIDQTDDQSLALHGKQAYPWEAVSGKVRELGRRLNVSDSMFPIQTLVPMLQRYAMLPHEHKPPRNWALDLFLDLDIPHETLLPVMEQMYYGNEHPFVGSKRKVLAAQMVYLLQSWFAESERKGERVAFGNEEYASLALDCAAGLLRTTELDATSRRDAEVLVASVQKSLR